MILYNRYVVADYNQIRLQLVKVNFTLIWKKWNCFCKTFFILLPERTFLIFTRSQTTSQTLKNCTSPSLLNRFSAKTYRPPVSRSVEWRRGIQKLTHGEFIHVFIKRSEATGERRHASVDTTAVFSASAGGGTLLCTYGLKLDCKLRSFSSAEAKVWEISSVQLEQN